MRRTALTARKQCRCQRNVLPARRPFRHGRAPLLLCLAGVGSSVAAHAQPRDAAAAPAPLQAAPAPAQPGDLPPGEPPATDQPSVGETPPPGSETELPPPDEPPPPGSAPEVLPLSHPTSDSSDVGETAEDAERRRQKEEYDRRRFAQYDRNYFVLRLAPTRSHVSFSRTEFDYWAGRVDGGLVIPFDDGAARMWWVLFGIGGGPVDDGFVWSVPMSFAYGFRSPVVMGYLGGTFGLGGAGGKAGGGEAGPLYGGVAALGVRLNRLQLFVEGRFEGVLLRAGQSYTQYSYGPVLALEL